jgi:hypothetical protein
MLEHIVFRVSVLFREAAAIGRVKTIVLAATTPIFKQSEHRARVQGILLAKKSHG